MKTIIPILLILLIAKYSDTKSQNSVSTDNLSMYIMYIDGVNSEESGLYYSRKIMEIDNVLIAFCNQEGYTRIISESELDLKAVFEKLMKFPNIVINDRFKVAFEKSEFLEVYSGVLPAPHRNLGYIEKLIMPDKDKQERVYLMAVSLWEDKSAEIKAKECLNERTKNGINN